MMHAEHDMQVAVVAFAHGPACGRWPELRLLHAIPNAGRRSRITGARMRGEGLAAGVPDLHLPVARAGFHGLYIEMKTDVGQLTAAQRAWHVALVGQGHRVEVCRSAQAAIDILMEYLGARVTT